MRILLIPMACALLMLAACGGGDSPFIETPTASPTVAGSTQTPVRTAAPTTPTDCEPTQYEVQEGDVLFDIATEFGVTIDAIAEASDLDDPDSLSIGQELTIPCPEPTETPAEEDDSGA